MFQRSRCVRKFVRGGFTVLECLAVIAVIGLLLAVILPAIQSTRETGRRSACSSHLHQFGTALSAFESAHRRLPGSQGPCRAGRCARYSAHFLLLPYFEQSAIYNMIDFTQYPPRFADDATPGQLYAATYPGIPAFQCPSDPTDHGNNYRFSSGPSGLASCWGPPPHNCPDAGAFGIPHGVSLAAVFDGASHTAGVSERCKSDDNLSAFSPLDFWYSGRGALAGAPSNDEIISIARGLVHKPLSYNPRVGHFWVAADPGKTTYTQLLEPNSPVLDCSVDGGGPPSSMPPAKERLESSGGLHLARSFHSGGVNVLMLDGAVRVAANEIDLQVWRESGTIGGPR